MATLVLSTAGAAFGSSLGGSILGLSMSAVGRFAGATLGRAIDQRILGSGGQTIETGRLDRLRLSGAGAGHAVAQVYGRVRVGGTSPLPRSSKRTFLNPAVVAKGPHGSRRLRNTAIQSALRSRFARVKSPA